MIHTLSEALAERGYETLTPVQEAVTQPELQDADLLVSAQTGSGKTVGFGLAIGTTLLGENGKLGPAAAPLALIVAPTRELAFQVTRELEWLYAKAGARVASCVGGMDMRDERRTLERGAHIVVGTPGRLRDHIQRRSLDMTGLRAVVLDEADEMLDLGFREDLEFMLGEAPQDRRTLLFSATVPPMIATLARQYQRDAVRVTTVSEKGQHADIAYQALRVAPQDGESAIINVLRFHDAQNAIVFANTRAAVNRLAARFGNRGFAVVTLSGELSQAERTHALQAMRDGRARVCVATDVAARGIDLPNLELVVHAELPSNVEGLLHRSGRTGRAGRKGISALIVPPKMVKRAERLLRSAGVTAEWIGAPGAEEILRRDEERLLNDPTWSQDITDGEGEFAAKLLDLHSPQAIAAAYLRLYRSKHSAPEELSSPDARGPATERAPFGPSQWFALSVGRDDRAEPRWLLPLLCRAGGLTKEAIGAIRVQQTETFVELTQASVPNFEAALGEGGTLEDGVSARKIDGAPEFGGSRGAPRPDGPKRDKPRHDGPKRSAAKPSYSKSDAPAPVRPADKPADKPVDNSVGKPVSAEGIAPKEVRSDFKEQTQRPAESKKPAYVDKSEKPFNKGKPTGKPGGKPGKGKPFKAKGGPDRAKSGTDKPRGPAKPARDRDTSAASDTSRRFKPPRGAGAKPGARPASKGARKPGPKPGGHTPPRRPKS